LAQSSNLSSLFWIRLQARFGLLVLTALKANAQGKSIMKQLANPSYSPKQNIAYHLEQKVSLMVSWQTTN